MILAHELAHIRRHDYAVNMIQMAVETMLFYHPAVWWVSARMRDERELCCDDVVIRTLGDRLTYARALTALERLRLGAPTLALASTDGSLSYRVRRLLEPSPSSSHPMKLPTLLTVCLALACAAPVIDSPKAKSIVSQATAESLPANNEKGDGGSRDDSKRIAAGHPNPKETGDSQYTSILTKGRLVVTARIRSDVDGLRLAAIQMLGVSPALRDQIHLPFALGDTLVGNAPSRIEAALRKVDPRLMMLIKGTGNGDASLLISLASPKPIEPDQVLMDFQVEQRVKPARGNRAPDYPVALRRANVEGQVTVEFVVDTSGRADMGTFKQIKATNTLFTEAVKEQLPAMVFIPAEVGHHKVKQMVRMPFVFTLSK